MRILLVDDEIDFLEQERVFLENIEDDFEIDHKTSAEKALKSLKKNDYDAVVSDYLMPKMDGLDLLKEARDRGIDIPFIIFTGKGREEVAMEALNLGADRYLQKGGPPKSQYGILAEAVKQEYDHYKKAEELKRSEREKSLVLDSTDEIIAYHDIDHHIRWANKAYQEATGLSSEEIEGRKCYKAWGLDTICNNCPVTTAIEDGESAEAELTPENQEHWSQERGSWLVKASPVTDENGNVIGAVEVSTDITERKKAERDLRQEKEVFESVFSRLPLMVTIYDPDMNEFRVNEKFEEVLGWTNEEIQDIDLMKACYPDPDYREEVSEFMRKAEPEWKNLKIETKDGDKVESSWTNIILSDQRQIGIGIDLSEKRKLEERYRTLFETATDAIFIMEEDRFIDCNEKTLEMFDCEREDIIGESPYQIFSPSEQPDGKDSKEKALEKINRAYKGKPQSFEWKHRTLDGITFDTEVTLNSFELGDQRYLLAIVRDITERKKAEEKLKESEEKYRAIVEQSHDAIYIYRGDQFLFVNDRISEMTGYTKEELYDISIWDMVHPDDRERIKNIGIRRAQGEDAPNTYESRIVTKDGEVKHGEFSVSAITYEGDYAVLGAVRDITERKKAEEELKKHQEHLEEMIEERTEELEQKNKELKSFTYSVSHDLRAPLRSIEGFSNALKEDCLGGLGEKGREYTERITSAAQHMDELIDDLLEYSRLTRAEMKSKTVNLNNVIDRLLEDREQVIEEKEVEIEVEENMPNVEAHRSTVMRVLNNLLSNSIKFVESDRSPSITIWTEEKDDRVRIWVEDNGIGIDPEDQERIFDIFERLHGREEYKGTGVGLAIVKKGVERMGGDYGVESKKGEGSRFWIELNKVS